MGRSKITLLTNVGSQAVYNKFTMYVRILDYGIYYLPSAPGQIKAGFTPLYDVLRDSETSISDTSTPFRLPSEPQPSTNITV